MAIDIFSGSSGPSGPLDLFSGGGPQSGPLDLFSSGVAPQQPGFFRHILGELKRDFVGAGRVVGAGLGAPFHALGMQVPVTLEDINRRDVLGAAMVGSMVVGGVAVKGAQGIALGAKAAREGKTVAQAVKALPAWKKAGLVAAGETVAGASYGLVKGAVEDENLLSESIKNAAVFGAFGAGFSLTASGIRATVHGVGRMAGVQEAKAGVIQRLAQQEDTLTQLREFSGVRLRAPETGTAVEILRLPDGKVQLHSFNKAGTRAATDTFQDFNSALREALGSGHVENLGPARPQANLRNLENFDQGILETVAKAGDNIPEAVGQLELRQYRAVQEFASLQQQENQVLGWLGFEAMSEQVNKFGVISLKESERSGLLRLLAGDKGQLAKMDDSGLVKEALRQGKLSLENLADGANMRDYLKEIFVNDRIIGDSVVYAAMPAYDVTFLAHVITPRTLAKLHPEIRPLQQMADEAVQKQAHGTQQAKELLDYLQDRVPTKKAEIGARIIDDSQGAPTVQAAREAAIRAAKETGDEQVIEFVERTTQALNQQRLKLTAAGRLGRLSEENAQQAAQAREILGRAVAEAPAEAIEETALRMASGTPAEAAVRELIDSSGLSGYFPIRHFMGDWQLQVQGVPTGTYRRQFNSRDEALQEFRRVAAENPDVSGSVLPSAYGFDGGSTGLVDGKEWGRLIRAMRSAEGFENLTAAEAGDLLKSGGVRPVTGGPPRKGSPHLLERKLGIRDFTEDPYRSLDFYLNNTERVLAFNTFEQDAAKVIGQIPAAKGNLSEWAQNYTDLLMGRPTRSEKVVQSVAEAIMPGEVSPRILKQYSAAVRRFMGFSRLGGALSGIVNATQIAVNTVPLVGARWTAEGMRKIMTPAGMREVRDLFGRHGVDLGLHMPLTREGRLAGGESIVDSVRSAYQRAAIGEGRKAAKRGVEAFERTWLWAFNGAERLNRTVTGWAAYQKGLRELGMDQTGALNYAAEMVQRTQFDYSLSNIPTALQSPLGGLLGQFKTFFINEMELLATVDSKTRMKILAAFSATGGLATMTAMPGGDILDQASGFVFDRRMSEAMRTGGERHGTLSRAVVFGVPGLFNLDMSRHVGPGGFHDMLRGWAGPALSDHAALGQFLGSAVRDLSASGKVSGDTYNRFFQQAIPSQVRRAERALGILESGEVRNAYSSKLVYRPDDRLRAAAMQAIGFPTTEMSAESALDQALNRQIGRHRDVRASYGRQIGLAAAQGKTSDLSRLLQESRNRGFDFSPQDVRRWQREMLQPAAARRERRTPRDLRLEMEGLIDL